MPNAGARASAAISTIHRSSSRSRVPLLGHPDQPEVRRWTIAGPGLRAALVLLVVVLALAVIPIGHPWRAGFRRGGGGGKEGEGEEGEGWERERWTGDAREGARRVLERYPVLDSHIDLPILLRTQFAYNLSSPSSNLSSLPGHVDLPRIRSGQLGSVVWSAFVPCPPEGTPLNESSWRVRDTLEQIDVVKRLVGRYPDTFEFARAASDVERARRRGKVASLIGLEGSHQLGNSLATLRMYAELGVRYLTLTHTCDTAFADAGFGGSSTHGGLSPIGRTLIRELNRLAVLADLSHVSDSTASQALALSRAPVVWSHSGARAVGDHPRNVPDWILERLGRDGEVDGKGEGKGKKDGVVQVVFAPDFVAPNGPANVSIVADHIEHIARVAGKAHVGIGSDFDGIPTTPEGLEDVSAYPNLFAELLSRNWTPAELGGLARGNFLRVLRRAEEVAEEMRAEGVREAEDVWEGRGDLGRGLGEL